MSKEHYKIRPCSPYDNSSESLTEELLQRVSAGDLMAHGLSALLDTQSDS
jgi:hypothetical protein